MANDLILRKYVINVLERGNIAGEEGIYQICLPRTLDVIKELEERKQDGESLQKAAFDDSSYTCINGSSYP